MLLTDVPPPTAPPWLIVASVGCLSCGIFLWLASYVLMVRRSLATQATPVPLLALGLNVAWEVVYALYVTETALEKAGFLLWLVFDIPVVYATLKTARRSFASSPLVGRNAALLLAIVFVAGLVGNGLYVWWWLKEPHRGYGIKWGKTWKGREARDTCELAWWSAGVAQMVMSVGALAMLLQRGHSGGQSHAIWFCRCLGTIMGLPLCVGLLWWYWPEAHGYIWDPVSIIIIGTTVVCDFAYPFVLEHVQSTEVIHPDGSISAGDVLSDRETHKKSD